MKYTCSCTYFPPHSTKNLRWRAKWIKHKINIWGNLCKKGRIDKENWFTKKRTLTTYIALRNRPQVWWGKHYHYRSHSHWKMKIVISGETNYFVTETWENVILWDNIMMCRRPYSQKCTVGMLNNFHSDFLSYHMVEINAVIYIKGPKRWCLNMHLCWFDCLDDNIYFLEECS